MRLMNEISPIVPPKFPKGKKKHSSRGGRGLFGVGPAAGQLVAFSVICACVEDKSEDEECLRFASAHAGQHLRWR